MSRLGLSIAALFTLAVLLYLPTWMAEEPAAPVKPASEALKPAYRAKNLTTTLYDKSGNLNHEVFATAMEHYDLLGFVLFTSPQYTVYTDTGEPPWEVTAKEGTLYNNNLIQLESDVQIKSLSDDDLVRTIDTNFIEINLETKLMQSDEPVTIRGLDYVIESNGFDADLRSRHYELLNHVQTIYTPRD